MRDCVMLDSGRMDFDREEKEDWIESFILTSSLIHDTFISQLPASHARKKTMLISF